MLQNIFSFHIHSPQSSNTNFFANWDHLTGKLLFWRLGKWIFQNWISQIFMMCAWSWFHIFRNEMCIFNVWVSSNCSKNGESSGVRGFKKNSTHVLFSFSSSLSKLRFYRLASLLAIPILIARTQVQCSAGLCPWGSWWWWWWFLDNF